MIISDLQYLQNASDSQLVEGSSVRGSAFAFASASALAFGFFYAEAFATTSTVTDYLGEYFAGATAFSVSFTDF
jgi:hypothetical protein